MMIVGLKGVSLLIKRNCSTVLVGSRNECLVNQQSGT